MTTNAELRALQTISESLPLIVRELATISAEIQAVHAAIASK